MNAKQEYRVTLQKKMQAMICTTGIRVLQFHQGSTTSWGQFWKVISVLLEYIPESEIARQCSHDIRPTWAEDWNREYSKVNLLPLKRCRSSTKGSKGWFKPSKFFLPEKTSRDRTVVFDKLIAY